MQKRRFNLLILIVPILILAWGIFCLLYFSPLHARNIDPDYAYLINGLNVALFDFNNIGHIDHPGTPFQVFCGIVIRLTHLFAGKDTVSYDVLSRPDFYLASINLMMSIVIALLTYFIGQVCSKKSVDKFATLFLQSSILLSQLSLVLMRRVIPENMLTAAMLLFIIVFIKYGYDNKETLKFAVFSGVVIGFGLATKFNYMPIAIFPMLFLKGFKNNLIYLSSTLASFFVFILPIIGKIKQYFNFIFSIATHDGIYGQGEKQVFNFETVQNNFQKIFNAFPEIGLLIVAVIVMIILAFIYRKKNGKYNYPKVFVGIFLIIAVQLLMVSKHYKNTYLLPTVEIYGLVLFLIYSFIRDVFSDKTSKIIVIPVFVLFFCSTAIKTNNQVRNMNESRKYYKELEPSYKNILEDSFIITQPTWQNSQFFENGLLYGFCYGGNWRNSYEDLLKINPRLITYRGTENARKAEIWGMKPTSLDKIIATGNTMLVNMVPGSNRNEYIVRDIVKRIEDMQLEYVVDTLMYDSRTRESIISIKALGTDGTWSADSEDSF